MRFHGLLALTCAWFTTAHADTDGDGFEPPSDCNDLSGDIKPGALEVCEGGGPSFQIDNDCDGNVNTQGGVYFDDTTHAQLGSHANEYYYDADQDGFGNADASATWLCARSAEPMPSYYVSSNGDCDDGDETIHPAAAELCDNRDNDCDGVRDEPQPGIDPPLCTPLAIDADQDGFGSSDPDAESLCVCPGFLTDPENQPAMCNPGVESGLRTNIFFDDECWSPDHTDCADQDALIHPDEPTSAPNDPVDGADSDCNNLIGVLEIDCDGDGALPVSLGTDPGEVLASCEDATEAPTLVCFGLQVPLMCDSETWGVPVDWMNAIGQMSGPYRPTLGSSSCDGLDCDDLCPHRCEGRGEDCDGVDNDCSGTAGFIDGNEDGFPDALDPARIPAGTVDPVETDTNGEFWLYECSDPVTEQTAAPVSACEPLDVVDRPQEDADDDPDDDDDGCASGSCGCETGRPAPFGALALACLLFVARRTRQQTAGAPPRD